MAEGMPDSSLLEEMALKMAGNAGGGELTEEQKINESAYHHIVAFLKSDKLQQFGGLTNTEDRIKFIYKHEGYWPLLQVIRRGVGRSKGEKDAVLSRQMRDAGNTAFTQNEQQVALDCYNQALIYAPVDPWDGQGEEMALALANRSALFMRQEKTEDCLKDTTLALRCGYPKHLRYKLLQRHAKCLCDLGRFNEAKQYFKEALEFINQSKLNKDQKVKIRNEIQSALDAIKIKDGVELALNKTISENTKKENDASSEEDDLAEKNENEMSSSFVPSQLPKFERNPMFPALHKSISIKYDSARGRHAIATEDIKCGSCIAFEKPILSFLWGDQLLTHCSNCFTPIKALLPCFSCSAVVFCSETCRQTAWKSFHQYECKAIEAVTSVYQNIFVAFRAIAQKPLKYFLQSQKKFQKYDYHRAAGCYEYEYESDSESGETEPDSEDESHELGSPYRSDDYENLYNLVTHSHATSDADRLALATSATLLLYYLQISNYFGSSTSRDSERELNDNEVFIGRLLYHILEVIQYNTHDVAECSKFEPEKGVELKTIGCAINPTLALFNHSCDPNITRANIGNCVVVIATKGIRKGQEINDAYTMLYQDRLMSTRKRWLEAHYKFECKCEACVNKWPLHEFLNKSVVKKGANGKALHHIKKMFSTITKLTMADLSVGHYGRVHTMWSNYYQELAMVLDQPNKSYARLASRLQDVAWLWWGNRGLDLNAPLYRDHRINQRRSSSNMNLPHLLNSADGDEKEE